MKTIRTMTKSPVALATQALRVAKAGLATYSSHYSRKDFTQHQLFVILSLRIFFKTDYRGIIQLLQVGADCQAVTQRLDSLDARLENISARLTRIEKAMGIAPPQKPAAVEPNDTSQSSVGE
jgi:hypothetical protein